jgi:DNA mismatch endonuclease (patch repair protein)
MPATNVEYWEKKFKKNRERDVYVTEALQKQGWHVLRFWESSIVLGKASTKKPRESF